MCESITWGVIEDSVLITVVALAGIIISGPIVGQNPLLLFGVMTGSVIAGMAIMILHRNNVIKTTHIVGAKRRSVWKDVLLFGRVSLIISVLLLLLFRYFVLVVQIPPLIMTVLLSVVPFTGGALVVYRYRLETLNMPPWLSIDNWSVWTDVELFGIISAIVIIYTVQIAGTDPVLQFVTWGSAFACGATAVFLRRNGVFTARDPHSEYASM